MIGGKEYTLEEVAMEFGVDLDGPSRRFEWVCCAIGAAGVLAALSVGWTAYAVVLAALLVLFAALLLTASLLRRSIRRELDAVRELRQVRADTLHQAWLAVHTVRFDRGPAPNNFYAGVIRAERALRELERP